MTHSFYKALNPLLTHLSFILHLEYVKVDLIIIDFIRFKSKVILFVTLSVLHNVLIQIYNICCLLRCYAAVVLSVVPRIARRYYLIVKDALEAINTDGFCVIYGPNLSYACFEVGPSFIENGLEEIRE